ncbi:MAG: SDR family NAD(P)-dependent oxidoreductase [Proteobacteria bacterium]|nr:MAG: SDR family NAD(P)-dependent oxidoreductase [Pseudomonadota bacterium]
MTHSIAITGASSGIGKAIAEEFARRGAELFLGARRLEKLQTLKAGLLELGAKSVHVQELDVRENTSVEEWTDAAFRVFPRIDILVNNAGLVLGRDTIEAGRVDDWETIFDTNVMGVLRLCRGFLPHFRKNKHGHVIMIGSISGHQVYEGGGPYCASKFGVKALTQTLKLELNGSGIRVSSIDPGMVETEFSEVRFRGDKDAAKAVYQGFSPLQALDIAETVAFVATRPAHVNIDEIIIMPTDQASATKVSRT